MPPLRRRPAALAGLPCIRFMLPGFRDRWRFRAPGGDAFDVAVSVRLPRKVRVMID